MSGAVEIRPAEPEDLEAMLRLMRVLADEHAVLDDYFVPGDEWSEMLETMFVERMRHENHHVAVARWDGEVIGLVTATLRHHTPFRLEPRAVLENLVVAPEHRRRGIGTRLVADALEWCRARNAACIELSVAMANTVGCAFWERCGFRPVMLRLLRRGEDDDGE